MGSTNYVSLSLTVALQRGMDVAAHNLANAGTVGFKAAHPLFESMVSQSDSGSTDSQVSYLQDKGDFVDKSQGSLMRTDNPLDVALSGSGWFAYQGPIGQTAFGRDGKLLVDVQGALTTLGGAKILDPGGAPISLPLETGDRVSIGSDGSISTYNGVVVANIGVFEPPNEGNLTSIGSGLYIPKDQAAGALVPATKFQISQGFLEQSNVQPVLEMTRMMAIQRAYEQSVKLLSSDSDLTQQALQRLGRLA